MNIKKVYEGGIVGRFECVEICQVERHKLSIMGIQHTVVFGEHGSV